MYTREDVQRILQNLLLEIVGNHYHNATSISERSHNNATEDAADEVRKVMRSITKEN